MKDLYEADRALSIATALGKVINLLKVDTPPQERQILLKVRFADVDRTKVPQSWHQLFRHACRDIRSSATTGELQPDHRLHAPTTPVYPPAFHSAIRSICFLFDPHVNIGATLQALAAQNVLQILAEPNLLAMNGKEASFVAGGEFPFPTLQGGGGGVGQITISFKEFGIRLHFLPTITPRGTIRLHVTPEVSSLDYANSLTVSGSTIPALDTRRVDTEVELQSGQSFAIAGLLDNQTTEALSKIPGLANIPVLGKLFTSKSITKSNSELLVIVTPELVAPIPEGQAPPDLPRPDSFIQGPGILTQPPRTPGTDQTGPGPARPVREPKFRCRRCSKSQRAQPSRGRALPRSLLASGAPLMINPAAAMPPPAAGDSASSRREDQLSMMPLTAAFVISNRTVWEQAHACIQNLPVRLAVEQGMGQSDPAETDALLDRIERHRVDVVLVEASRIAMPLEEFVRRIRSTAAQPAVFVLNPEASPELILEALRAGANEYLYPPLADTLRDALQRLSTARSKGGSDTSDALGKIFGFLSARGGCGATTFAVHVASSIIARRRDQLKQPTLLADFDFDAGLLRFLMKSKSTYSVRDAIDNLRRMDSSLWKALVSSHADNAGCDTGARGGSRKAASGPGRNDAPDAIHPFDVSCVDRRFRAQRQPGRTRLSAGTGSSVSGHDSRSHEPRTRQPRHPDRGRAGIRGQSSQGSSVNR